jgi:hypothetical protein
MRTVTDNDARGVRTRFWIVVDVNTGLQPNPPLKFLEASEAENYHLRAFHGSTLYEVREMHRGRALDPALA